MRTVPHTEFCNGGVGLIAANAIITPVNAEEATVNNASTGRPETLIRRGRKQTTGDTTFDSVKPR